MIRHGGRGSRDGGHASTDVVGSQAEDRGRDRARQLDPRGGATSCGQSVGRDQADAAGAQDRQRRTGATAGIAGRCPSRMRPTSSGWSRRRHAIAAKYDRSARSRRSAQHRPRRSDVPPGSAQHRCGNQPAGNSAAGRSTAGARRRPKVTPATASGGSGAGSVVIARADSSRSSRIRSLSTRISR
jgi:hypothetical protein